LPAATVFGKNNKKRIARRLLTLNNGAFSQTTGIMWQVIIRWIFDNINSSGNKRATMTIFKKYEAPHTAPRLTAEESDKRRKRRWKRRLKTRAAIIKRQLQIENRFHKAMREMRTTTDQHRRSYLHWILHQMFSLFDYETGLRAINDKAAYQAWLSENAQKQK